MSTKTVGVLVDFGIAKVRKELGYGEFYPHSIPTRDVKIIAMDLLGLDRIWWEKCESQHLSAA